MKNIPKINVKLYIHEDVLNEYIFRIDSQYENLKKLYDELIFNEQQIYLKN